MRYSGLFAKIYHQEGPRVHRLRLAGLALLIFSTFAPLAAAPADEIKDLVKQASKLTRNGSFVEAEIILRRAVALDASRSEAKVELAFVLAKQRVLTEAYELAFAVARDEPKNARAMSVLGATLLAGGRFADARLIFYKALATSRREHLAWAGYGMLDFYENNISESLLNLDEALFYEPNEPDYLFAKAQVSARDEQYEQAADAYRDYLSVSNPADADRRARIKGLISFLRYLGNTGRLYMPEGREKAAIPFELVGNRPIIQMRVNGKPELLRFVLDTGSGISVVSEETAKRLKVKMITRGGHARGIGGDGKFEIVYGMIRHVEIGGVAVRNVPVYIRKFHKESHPVDGYIGLALISKFLTTIDYGTQTFSLTRKEADAREFRENGAVSLPLRLTSSGFLSGEVQVDGLPAALNFIVDTGASVSVISDRVSKIEGISQFVKSEKLRVIGSAGITDDVPSFLLPRVTFGSHSRTGITAVALDLDIINEASGFEQSGILGGNFLKNYRLTFDFKNSKVTFVSLEPEKD